MKLKLLVLALLVGTNTFSQERKLTGRILDIKTQKPIKNANIIIMGTTSGAVSNQLGFFELTVDASKQKTLIVSHIGFKTSHVLIPAEDRFKFFLEKEFIVLSQLDLNLYSKNRSTQFNAEGSKEPTINQTAIESGASFPNGIVNFYNYIGNSLASHLSSVKELDFSINFTINESGQAVEISPSDSTKSTKSAVNQTFESMPKWIPATQKQNKVPQHFILPVIKTEIPNIETLDVGGLYEFIWLNIKYPAQARRMGVEGAVYIEFQLDTSGNVISTILLKDIGADCGEETKRIITAIPVELTKSLYDQTHATKFILPVFFRLNGGFRNQEYSPKSDAILLSGVYVTAIGIEREHRGGSVSGLSRSTPSKVGSPSNNSYNNLSKALEKPKTARRLSLIDNSLKSFPSDILKLTNLEFLDLEKNQLQILPGEIENLGKLQELYLFENQIQVLPGNFVNLKQLKVLGLASNQLKNFPLQICSLENLEALDLSDNQLSSIPKEIGAMKNLRFLVLRNNSISNFPIEFYGLKKLKIIFLQGNPINPKDMELLKATFKEAEIVL